MLRLWLIDILRRTRILRILRELTKQQYIPGKELDEYRHHKLQTLFQKAKRSAKYYAAYKSYEELPILKKDVLRNNMNDFISAEHKKKIYRKETGGSTGTPLIYYTTSYCQSYMWAGIILAWEVAGYQIGDEVAIIAGSSLFKSSWRHSLFYKLLNVKVYSAFTLDDETIQQYIERLKRKKTKIIYGYANAIGAIADYINKNEPVSFPYLKGIVSTAEVLTDKVRHNIEQAFKVKVYNQYGCNEAGLTAFECEHHFMHLVSSRCYYETAENGHLISTDLTNEAMIMMKYDTGDVVRFSSEQNCACKRNFPIIEKVVGRSNDVVIDANNKIVHSAFFGYLFRNDKNIKQFQVSFDEETITINLLVDLNSTNWDYNHYLDIIKKHFEFKNYNVVINAPFLKAENAKHKYVINNCKEFLLLNQKV